MRKALLFAPMLMLLLAACGGGEKDAAAELQAQYAAVTSAAMEADVTCHYDGEEREYALRCDYAPEESTVTVLSPENLAGISATVTGGTLSLSYQDISLDAGSYSAAAISPVAALPRLMEAAASGHVTEQSGEKVGERSCLRLACDLPNDSGALYTTWFDQETLLPLHSEIAADGTVVYEVDWTRFEVTGQKEAGDQAVQPNQPAQDAPQGEPESGGTAGEEGQPEPASPAEDAWTEADEAAAYAAAEE